jgi:dynactin-6
MAPRSRLSEATIPRPPVTLAPTIVIADTAQLTGTFQITIGSDTVIHPRAKLNSTLGPITVGSFCIINERTTLAAADDEGLVIEDAVVVEANAVVEARRIGEGTWVEVGVRVGRAAVVGKVCFPSLLPALLIGVFS